jgi:protein-arginine kinase activator protein McsA
MICRFCDKPAIQVVVDTHDDDRIPLCETCAAAAAYAMTCTPAAISAFEYATICYTPVTMTIEEFRAYEVAQ